MKEKVTALLEAIQKSGMDYLEAIPVTCDDWDRAYLDLFFKDGDDRTIWVSVSINEEFQDFDIDLYVDHMKTDWPIREEFAIGTAQAIQKIEEMVEESTGLVKVFEDNRFLVVAHEKIAAELEAEVGNLEWDEARKRFEQLVKQGVRVECVFKG